MVKIIAHRGWWTKPEEQNTLAAFKRAFDAGIGVELDVRDLNGYLVVSHDPPQLTDDLRWTGVRFQEVLDLLGDRDNILAVNVKSCGLAPWFAKLKAPKNWFFFDMAFNDEGEYEKHKLKIICPREEIDFLISPELYGCGLTMSQEVWGQWKTSYENFTIMTDFPQEAMEFFR